MNTGVDAPSPDLDTLYDLLSAARRRYVLYYFLKYDQATVDELGQRIAAREHEGSIEGESAELVEAVTVSLIHKHVPRLADHGLVTYDRRNDEIGVGERFEAIRETVERARKDEEVEPIEIDSDAPRSFRYSDPVTEPTSDE
ncbi:DUF7344 domain-containing protein [Natrinema salifodinae]|uniref:DUF7344 domain-containing protein n=1 Tax=Natrinema salifodinae TaxID=1202768 RepID=A0A1I0MMS2_9EURY|nr:hypothetical protein [Natrinema salifodinae]SEV89276.1 hypothetical protein SAMN05216285_1133 [Natrinema salifodinae]